jgi:predicted ATPase
MIKNIQVNSLGPIKEANIHFGDLTLFVGTQASGKSILLQLIKLMIDKSHIRKTLEQYGYVWSKDSDKILELYFGEGMSGIWTEATSIKFDGNSFLKDDLQRKRGKTKEILEEQLFYIPAQRVICFSEGWPRFFTNYDVSVPYVLRYFSETLRQSLENSNGSKEDDNIFPQSQRLREPLRNAFNESIFHNGKIALDKSSMKRQFKLNIDNMSLPFMAWSAGQKEFMPLLLSFYWLCPPSKVSRKDELKYVIIEEPEMGLHPQAITTVILQIIDLIARGYKIILSTHSPIFLEFAWAFNLIKKNAKKESKALYELFDMKRNAQTGYLFDSLLEKDFYTYYFNRENDKTTIKDISSLDAASEDTAISEWGGLSSFASKATDIVSKSVN